jgi:hypothetical protein
MADHLHLYLFGVGHLERDLNILTIHFQCRKMWIIIKAVTGMASHSWIVTHVRYLKMNVLRPMAREIRTANHNAKPENTSIKKEVKLSHTIKNKNWDFFTLVPQDEITNLRDCLQTNFQTLATAALTIINIRFMSIKESDLHHRKLFAFNSQCSNHDVFLTSE